MFLNTQLTAIKDLPTTSTVTYMIVCLFFALTGRFLDLLTLEEI